MRCIRYDAMHVTAAIVAPKQAHMELQWSKRTTMSSLDAMRATRKDTPREIATPDSVMTLRPYVAIYSKCCYTSNGRW